MTTVTQVLGHAVGIAFILLGVAATVGWLRHRGRSRLWLAAALGLLGLVCLVHQLSSLTHTSLPGTVQLSIAGFTGSGLALVELRHVLVPLPRRAHRLVIAAVGVVTVVALAVPLPTAAGARYSALQLAVVLALIVLWAGCVSEPAITFWRASRQRPTVQRARLRTLAGGYLGLVAVLLVALGAGSGGAVDRDPAVAPGDGRDRPALPRDGAGALRGLRPAALPPPRLAGPEEHAYRSAVHDLLLVSADEASLTARALEWAVRLVGADAGVLVSPSGRLVTTPGMSQELALPLVGHPAAPDPRLRARHRGRAAGGRASGGRVSTAPSSSSPGPSRRSSAARRRAGSPSTRPR